MKTKSIPTGALPKAWAYSLRASKSIGLSKVLVAERDGVTGRLLCDRLLKRQPASATCVAVLYEDGPKGRNFRAGLHWSITR